MTLYEETLYYIMHAVRTLNRVGVIVLLDELIIYAVSKNGNSLL